MGKIVLELQKDALSKDIDILNLLRKAYLVARKLKLTDFEKWISSELNGYEDISEVPSYRKVVGEIKAWNPYVGWVPVIIENVEISKMLSEHLISDSIPNLINVYDNLKGDKAALTFSPEINNMLSESSGFITKHALKISGNQIYNIMERVRNIVLDWSISLEENNILGEDLEFTEKEKEIASSSTYINNYTNIFYGDVSETQIQQDASESIQK